MPFAVLGHPIGHSLSPVMHNAAFQALGMDALYLAFDVPPARLRRTLAFMKELGFRGVNLTVPLKEVACRGLDLLDPTARIFGAVNTVQFLPHGLKGYSTDGVGFLSAVREAFDGTLKGRFVFVLGTGGAGRTVAMACAGEQTAGIFLADLDRTRARRVAREIARLHPSVPVQVVESTPAAWAHASLASDLVIQSTPVGMKPSDPSLLPPSAFRRGQWAFDLVYMYPETGFMRAARRAGAHTSNGLGMLLHQGAASFKIWTGKTPPVPVMRRALEKAVYGK